MVNPTILDAREEISGTGGPSMLTVADLNVDGAPDLVYLDHVVMSGPIYDSLRVFDGKRNLVGRGHMYMNSTLKLTKNSNRQAEIKIDGQRYGLSLGGWPGSPPDVVLTPLGRP